MPGERSDGHRVDAGYVEGYTRHKDDWNGVVDEAYHLGHQPRIQRPGRPSSRSRPAASAAAAMPVPIIKRNVQNATGTTGR